MLKDFKAFLLRGNVVDLAVAVVITRDCPECLSSVPRAARRCAFCTAQIGG